MGRRNNLLPKDDLSKINTYEGIAYYKDTKFFVGHQNNPVAFAVYDTSTGTTSSPVAVTEVSEIADLYYDGTYLWIVDSKTCNICKYFVSENKEVVSLELIEKYTASTLARKNPEAIVAEEDFETTKDTEPFLFLNNLEDLFFRNR